MRLLAAPGLMLLASCAPSTDREITVGAGDLVLAAISGKDGLEAVVRVEPGAATPTAAPTGGRLSLFVIARGDIVGEDGRPAAEAVLEGLEVRLQSKRAAPSGSCGRCLDPDDRAPVLAHAGSSCPPPAFSVFSDDEELRPTETDRLEIRLDWPGPCSCSLQPIHESPELEVLPVPHALETEPDRLLPQLAITPRESGDVAIFASRRVAVARESGEVIASSPSPIVRYPELAIPLSNGRTLVAEHVPSLSPMPELPAVVFSRDLVPTPVRISRDGLFFSIHTRRAKDDRFVVFGSSFAAPTVQVCDPDRDGWTCSALVTTSGVLQSRHYVDGAIVPAGADREMIVAIGRSGNYFYTDALPRVGVLGAPPISGMVARTPDNVAQGVDGMTALAEGPPLRWRMSYAGAIETPWGSFRVGDHFAIGRAGRRVFTCTSIEDGRSASIAVLSREIGPELFTRDPAYDALEWRPLLCLKNLECAGFATVTGTVTAVDLFLSDRTRVRFDASGAVIEGAMTGSCLEPRLPTLEVHEQIRAVHAEGDLTVLETRDLSVYIRRDEGAFVPVFGPASGRAPPPESPSFGHVSFGAIVSSGDRFWAIGKDGLVAFVGPDRTRRDLPVTGGPVWSGTVLAAAIDRSFAGEDAAEQRVVIFGADLSRSWMAHLRVSEAEAILEGPPAPLMDVGTPIGPPVDAVEVVPGTILVAMQVGDLELPRSLYRYRDGQLARVEIDDVDPVTRQRVSFVMRGAEQTCPPRRPLELFPYSPGFRAGVRAVDAAQGVAWAVACSGIILKVDVLSEPPRAEVRDPQRSPESFRGRVRLPQLTGVRALCADDVLLGSDSPISHQRAHEALFWRIMPPSSETRLADMLDLAPELVEHDTRSTELSLWLRSGAVFDIVGEAGSLTAVYAGGHGQPINGVLQGLGAQPRYRTGLRFDAVATDRTGQILIATEGARLLLARPL